MNDFTVSSLNVSFIAGVFAGHGPSRGSVQKVCQTSRVGRGDARNLTGRVGSGGVLTSPVGTGSS